MLRLISTSPIPEAMYLCAISQTNKVGVDIEETKPTTIDEFKDLFHESEWAQITRQIDNPSEFYNFWTKKESFIKVIGTGLHMPLNKFSVLDNKLTWENKNWYFFNLQIAPGYIAHLATDTKAPHIDTQMIHFD
jgi:4'-phosphopantetheinyl transferase